MTREPPAGRTGGSDSERDAGDPVALYLEARRYIDVEVVRLTPRNSTPDRKLAAVFEFNQRLGNPQARFPSVQVAGTSGKGSTAHALACILSAAGFKTGLHVSPYLQVATEKTWVDGLYASAAAFHTAYRAVRPTAEEFRFRDDCGASVHGMASLGLTYKAFEAEGIDWAVMETGLGGRFDLVQGLDRKLSVITDIGFDHMESLGHDLQSIAWHKAGIMAGAAQALVVRDPQTWPVFEREAAAFGTPLFPVDPDAILAHTQRGTVLRLPFLGDIDLGIDLGTEGLAGAGRAGARAMGTEGLAGAGRAGARARAPGAEGGVRGFPLRNMAVAAMAADRLAKSGVRVTGEHVARGLSMPLMPGRLEVVGRCPLTILDGAHNPQKMGALARSLPRVSGRLLLVCGLSGHREGPEILAALGRRPDRVFTTQATLYGKKVADACELADALASAGHRATALPRPPDAVGAALNEARPDDLVLCTGSIYLLGEIRSVFYPWQDVLVSRSSYPCPGK